MAVDSCQLRDLLAKGLVIPASPLALTAERKLDERRQRALWRYYIAAGSGGIAIGVHTTQFAIRDPKIGLFRPLLELGKEEMDKARCPARPHRRHLRPDASGDRGSRAAARAGLLRRAAEPGGDARTPASMS